MLTVNETEEIQKAGDYALGPDGILARELPSYEPRRPQIQMANLCHEVMEQPGHALIEAGTGTGKSFGYLIPAILSGKRVVVSTDTIALQQQLVDKDLPFLARVLGRPVKYAIAKGRSNFLCERNTLAYLQEGNLMDQLGRMTAQDALQQFQAGAWDGDKANLRIPITDSRWSVLAGDESCTGKGCPHAHHCPYLHAREKYEDADIIITNHTMYLLHHYVLERSHGTVGILPEHTVWVADEAHTLADKLVDVFGVEIHDRQPAAYVKRVLRQAKALDLDLGHIDTKAINLAAEELFFTFHGATKQEQLLSEFPAEILELARERMERLVEALKPIRLALYWAVQKCDPEDREKLSAASRLYDAADLLIDNLRAIFEEPDTDQPEPDCVVFAEVTGNSMGARDVTLHRKPIETRPIFRRILGRLDSAVFTSATLANGYGPRAWAPVAEELGLDLPTVRTMQVDSPFDYPRQVIGYVPAGMPEGRSPEYHTALADEIIRILNYTLGRAFVLFTSRRDMQRVFELIEHQVRYPILLQGDAPKDELIRQFKETPNSVLFGLKTFWAGVDIPGDSLSCVILVKLPFPQPEHPLNKARCERIERRGGNGFRDFSLPRCIRDVKQGFGRLIRTKNDSGVFAILDPRMRTSRYGGQIADALPNFPCVKQL